MKVTDIKTYILRVPLGEKRFYSSQCPFPERNSLLVKIETDEGIYGWGEGGQYGPPEPVQVVIEKVLKPMVINQDPLDREIIWHHAYNMTRDFGQRGTYIEAMSAVDIALWDISGKVLGVPVNKLLGGCQRDAISTYATGCYYRGDQYLNLQRTLEALAEEAKKYKDFGFKMIKIKIGLLPVDQDEKRIEAIRNVVGDEVKIFADANHAYNVNTAIRMGHILEKYNALFFEEPVEPENIDGYKTVRSKLDIAIAGGETEFTLFGFRDLISSGGVDIAQPDLCCAGGFSEVKRITAFAQAYGVAVIPHAWGSGIALAAALQTLAAMPLEPHTANPVPMQNEPMIEYDRNFNPLRDELLINNIRLEDGMVKVPDGPGLGVDIDMNVLSKYLS